MSHAASDKRPLIISRFACNDRLLIVQHHDPAPVEPHGEPLEVSIVTLPTSNKSLAVHLKAIAFAARPIARERHGIRDDAASILRPFELPRWGKRSR
jgi:hypothetical protein